MRNTSKPRVSLAVAALGISLLISLPAHALLNTWTNPVSGSWSDASKWTGGGVPTGTDSATFNKAGTYTVNFSNVFQNLTDMFVTAGNVTFERVSSPATLTIVAAGYDDQLTVGTATLNMGLSLPVNITTSNDTNINSGGTINVNVGSLLNVGFDLNVNSGGALTVSSNGDVLSKDGFIGSVIGTVGTATVTGAGSTWATTSSSIVVGTAGDGVLMIQNGGSVTGASDVIANSAGTTGTATVTGTGSSWSNPGLLTVGAFGSGTLNVENGATVTSGGSVIGYRTGSTGAVTVTGTGSKWTLGGDLPIGSSGTGALTIADGGTVNVGGGAGQVTVKASSTLNIGVGGAAGILQAGAIANNGVLTFDHIDAIGVSAAIFGSGQIVKAGSGDTTLANVSAFTGSYSVQDGLTILQGNANGSNYFSAGNGTLRFSGGAVNVGLGTIQAGSAGAIEYDSARVLGGYLRGPGTHTILAGASQTTFTSVTTYNSTNIVQNGSTALINFTNGGTFTSNAALIMNGGVNAATGVMTVNSSLLADDLGNSGVITVGNGGVINNTVGNLINSGGSRTTINAAGAINLLSGTTMELNGALLVNNGTVSGTVNVNFGALAKGTGGYGLVNVNQGGVYSPGNSPGISNAAAVTFQSGLFTSGAPQLVMELGGTTAGTQYDQLHVTGALALNGTLDIELVDLGSGTFSPHAGNSFDLLDWGSLSGTFSTIQLPVLGSGLTWNTSQLYTSGVLSVVPAGVPGDYNNNGVVDAADYVVWRNFNNASTTLPNDTTPGTVDSADYAVWRAHFGQTAGTGSGIGAVAVPEPMTWMLGAMAGVLVAAARGRSKRTQLKTSGQRALDIDRIDRRKLLAASILRAE